MASDFLTGGTEWHNPYTITFYMVEICEKQPAIRIFHKYIKFLNYVPLNGTLYLNTE